MADTNIEWADKSWNPVVGCTKVSEGCRKCYAEKMSVRLAGMACADVMAGRNPGAKEKYTAVVAGGKWNGRVVCDESALEIPLHWKKPRTIFVCSMSDLFHPDVPFEFIDKVFSVMALCQQHRFMVLTKRPKGMAEYLTMHQVGYRISRAVTTLRLPVNLACVANDTGRAEFRGGSGLYGVTGGKGAKGCWPLPNVMLGTSCEDQKTADERIPHLLKCPAAVRFLSLEPLLGPVDISQSLYNGDTAIGVKRADVPTIDHIIIGGESGAGARPCNIEWIRDLIAQAKAAGVSCFVKQLGAKPYDPSWHGDGTPQGSRMLLNHPKGGDPAEWPADLRVHEFPAEVGP